MKLCIFTIVLDGMPWITKHLPVFQQLKCDWEWTVIHGAAMNNGSTRWCKPQEGRLSTDGTTEYLKTIASNDHDDIRPTTVVESEYWRSKDEMVNAALKYIDEPCVLMEIDADEIWTPYNLECIVAGFCADPLIQMMKFACRYFVGENLITQGEHCYGDMDYEWNRAWRFMPGMRFKSHEPPILDTPITHFIDKDVTRKMGLVFDHYAYATEAQVRFKEQWYGRNGEYDGLLDGWQRLQEVKDFPVRLRDYFPHVKTDLPLVVKANGLG